MIENFNLYELFHVCPVMINLLLCKNMGLNVGTFHGTLKSREILFASLEELLELE